MIENNTCSTTIFQHNSENVSFWSPPVLLMAPSSYKVLDSPWTSNKEMITAQTLSAYKYQEEDKVDWQMRTRVWTLIDETFRKFRLWAVTTPPPTFPSDLMLLHSKLILLPRPRCYLQWVHLAKLIISNYTIFETAQEIKMASLLCSRQGHNMATCFVTCTAQQNCQLVELCIIK